MHLYFQIEDYENLIKFTESRINQSLESRKPELLQLLAESYYRLKKYDKAIYYYKFSARFYNCKAIINLLFHSDKASNANMFKTYLKKLKYIYTKYKQYMESKYIEKCKNIIKKYQHLL